MASRSRSDIDPSSVGAPKDARTNPETQGAVEHAAPATCEPDHLSARADREKVQQILLNLLSNAVKFTERGGRIQVRCDAADGRVRIKVCDTGIGMPDEQFESIFEPFVQIGRALNHPTEGTGLGLAISCDPARGMSGDLEADSELGVGSTITLVLPTADEAPLRSPD